MRFDFHLFCIQVNNQVEQYEDSRYVYKGNEHSDNLEENGTYRFILGCTTSLLSIEPLSKYESSIEPPGIYRLKKRVISTEDYSKNKPFRNEHNV